MSLKRTMKESLTFSKKERVGIIFLLPVILIIAFLPFLKTQTTETKISPADSIWLAAAGNLQEKKVNESPGSSETGPAAGYQMDHTEGHYENAAKGELFNFDPNTLGIEGFKKLGLRDKTIRTLINYRNKGGKFRKPDDLAKVYGLKRDEFERLRPFISITGNSADRYPVQNNSYNTSDQSYRSAENKPRYAPKIIEVNTADIAAFESLYGIGNKLAAKIVNFRDKLGGFYSISQVGETYGVPDSTFQKIKAQLKVDTRLIKKIDINAATYDELNNHPYISGKLAFQVLKQRKEKGKFTGIEEIKESVAQTTDSYEKISMYITAGN